MTDKNTTYSDLKKLIKLPKYEKSFMGDKIKYKCELLLFNKDGNIDLKSTINDSDIMVVFLESKKLMVTHNKPIIELPKGLTELRLGYFYNHPLPDLPKGLTVLRIGYSFNHPLPELPEGLKELWIDDSFNHPLPELPEGLTKLWIGDLNYLKD